MVDRREDYAAWAVIDRISQMYIGGPYPLREDRALFVVEPEHELDDVFG